MEYITITELMRRLNYQISSGGPYLWNCYGKSARYMMFGDIGDHDINLYAECVFDTNNLEVYEIRFLHGKDEQGKTIQYVWRHPEYKSAYRKEAALWREAGDQPELPYKQLSLTGVIDNITKHIAIA